MDSGTKAVGRGRRTAVCVWYRGTRVWTEVLRLQVGVEALQYVSGIEVLEYGQWH